MWSSQSRRAVLSVSSEHCSTDAKTLEGLVDAFFTPTSKKKAGVDAVKWSIVKDSVLQGKYRFTEICDTLKQHKQLAAFDLDGTVVKTKSNARFPKDERDWTWWHDTVPKKLRALYSEGYAIVFFSNQGGISIKAGAVRYGQWKTKLNAIITELDIPVLAYGATGTKNQESRKPNTGVWRHFLAETGATAFDEAFFVGDAAGRAKDFSATDRKFALNIGVPFHTPDEYFLSVPKEAYKLDGFDPRTYKPASNIVIPTPSLSQQEMIVLVGSPASGKSTFCRTFFPTYTRINQDTLKTRPRCVEEATKALKKGESVCIDNTNATKEVRQIWIRLAKNANVSVRCFHLTTSQDISRHNNMVRGIGGIGNEKRDLLPLMAFSDFLKRFQSPTKNEGFDELLVYDFAFTGTEEDRKAWDTYYL